MGPRDIYPTEFDEEVPNETTTRTTSSCPDCGGVIRTNTSETVCEDCGLIVEEELIDHGPEWREFEGDGCRKERTGAPLTQTRHDRGLSTTIGRKRDANGNTLSGRKRRQLGRLRRQQSRGRWRSTAERNLAHGLGETRRVADGVDLAESMIEQACMVFRRAHKADLIRGRSIEGMAAASVYGVCRCNGLSRSGGAIAQMARVEQSRVEHAYNVLNRELGLPSVPPTPMEHIPQFASVLAVSEATRRRATRLAEIAYDRGIANGRSAAGVAAAALYEAIREQNGEVTQRSVADVADVSTMTLRARWQELRDETSGEHM